jgi:hypothetical protein
LSRWERINEGRFGKWGGWFPVKSRVESRLVVLYKFAGNPDPSLLLDGKRACQIEKIGWSGRE